MGATTFLAGLISEVTNDTIMTTLIEFSGQFFADGKQIPFSVRIDMPAQTEPHNDYSCKVQSSELFSRIMNVYGVTRGQAIHLATKLVKDAITNRILTDNGIADDIAC